MWGLGCLVWEVYNEPLSQVSALRNTAKVRIRHSMVTGRMCNFSAGVLEAFFSNVYFDHTLNDQLNVTELH